MKRLARILLLGLIVAGLCAFTVFAQEGEADAASIIPTTSATFDEIALLFAPLAAAATGIERSLEMLWNWFETLFINFVALIAMGRKWAKWAGDEISHANNAVNQLASDLARLRRSQATSTTATPRAESALMRAMRDAEAQLEVAEARLSGVLKNERYRQVKSAVSVLAGVAMGIVIATTAKLKMFGLLGVEGVPVSVDMLVTGFVMGTGSAPVHSLIGILQSGKDALQHTSQLLQGRSEQARSMVCQTTRAGDGDVSSDADLYVSNPPSS